MNNKTNQYQNLLSLRNNYSLMFKLMILFLVVFPTSIFPAVLSGPTTVTGNAIPKFEDNKKLKNTGVLIDDNNNLIGGASGLTNIPGIVNVADYGANTNNAAAANKVAFQKAIDSLTNQVYSGYFGGTVYVPPGWWDLGAPIQIRPGVHLVGAGSKSTALAITKYLTSSNGIEFVTGDTYNYVPAVGIKGLSVILTSDSVAGDGIHLQTQDGDSYIRPEIDDVVVRGGWRYGIYIEDVMGGYCTASAVYNATNAGFYLNQFCNNFNLLGNFAKQNGDAGFKLGMNGGLVANNGSDVNTNAGFWITEDCIGTTFLGNTSEQNYTNQWLIEANDAGIDIIDCSSSKSALVGHGFYFNNAKGVRLLNPIFYTTQARTNAGSYGIYLTGTSDDIQVSRTDMNDGNVQLANFGSGVINDTSKLSKYEVDGEPTYAGGITAASFTGDGSGLTGVTATATNIPGELNVQDFGALGNGAADDRVAIQKALNHASTNATKHGVFFPAGTYLIGSTLNVDGSTSIGMYLRGEGPQVTTIRGTNVGMTMMNVAATTGIVKSMIQGITMDGDDLASVGIKLGSAGNNAVCAMDNMRFRSFTGAGVELFKCTSSSIDRSVFVFCNKGIWAHHSGGDDYPTSTRFRNLHMTLNTNAFYASYFQTFSMDGCTLEGNYGPAVMIDPRVDNTQPDHFSFKDCHFEGNQIYYLSNAAVTLEGTTQYKMESVTFDNCLFTGLAGPTERLIYFGPGDYTMKNCSFATPKAGAIALTNSGYLNLKIESAANDVLPTTYFTNLGAYANVRWDYNGPISAGESGGSPLSFTTYVNGGAGSLIPILSVKGSTNGTDVVTSIQGHLNANLMNAINVMAPPFNAKNVNTPDATAAIQMALNYARTNDGGRRKVTMPAGNFRVDGTLWIPTGVALEGEARGAYSTIINKNGTGATIAVTNGYCSIKNLAINTDDADPTGMYGIMSGTDGTSYMQVDLLHIEDVIVDGPEIGFYIRNSWTGELIDCTARNNVKGVVFTNTVNSTRITGGHYANNTNGIWIDMTTSAKITVSKASIEGNKQRGLYATNLRGPLNIEGNYFEVNGGSGWHTNGYDIDVDGGTSAVNLNIVGNYFHNTHTNIFVKNVSNTEIVGNRFEGGTGGYSNNVYIVANSGCYNFLSALNTFPDTGTNYLNTVPSMLMAQTNIALKGGAYYGDGVGLTNTIQEQFAFMSARLNSGGCPSFPIGGYVTNYATSSVGSEMGINLSDGYITNINAGTYKLEFVFGVGTAAGTAAFDYETNGVASGFNQGNYVDTDRSAAGFAILDLPANCRTRLKVVSSFGACTNYQFMSRRLR